MNIQFSPPDISENDINSVILALKSGWITTGPKTKLFEKKIAEYCGTKRAICMNSATACMEMVLRLLGIGPGDEVITSAYTYSASCSVICHVGATPVLVDTQENSFELDYDKLSNAITPRTKVIIPVDIAGVMCDYNKLFEVVSAKKALFSAKNKLQKKFEQIIILADAAHSFGAKKNGIKSGNVADFSCFSMHAVKNLTTAEGGAATWRTLGDDLDNEIYRELGLLSLHGQDKDALTKSELGNWEYDIIFPGYKCNMTDISAALGLSQLENYKNLLNRRKEIIKIYNEELNLKDLWIWQHLGEKFESSFHLYMTRLLRKNENYRNKFIEKMAEKGIPTNVHYKPLPMLTAYKNFGFDIKNYQNAFKMYENEVTLPLHTLLTDEQIHYITKTFKELYD